MLSALVTPWFFRAASINMKNKSGFSELKVGSFIAVWLLKVLFGAIFAVEEEGVEEWIERGGWTGGLLHFTWLVGLQLPAVSCAVFASDACWEWESGLKVVGMLSNTDGSNVSVLNSWRLGLKGSSTSSMEDQMIGNNRENSE